MAELPTPIDSWGWPTVRLVSVGPLDVPSPSWIGKGPDAYKDEPIHVSASSFSRLSHLISSATSSSSSSLSVSSPHSRAYSFRRFFLFLSYFAFLSRSPLARFAILMAESLGNGVG